MVAKFLIPFALWILSACAAQSYKNEASMTAAGNRYPIVLMYHDIKMPGERMNPSDIGVNDFLDHLDWLLENNYQTVSLNDLYEYKKNKVPLPVLQGFKPIVITFDDGYMGPYNFRQELINRQMHAAFFVHTGYVGDKSWHKHMSWDELKILEREGMGLFTVQSHSWTHSALDTQSARELDTEIRASRARIALELDGTIEPLPGSRVFFAYPMGRYNQTVLDLVRKNYSMAFAITNPKLNVSHIYEIPRVEMAFQKNGPVQKFAKTVLAW